MSNTRKNKSILSMLRDRELNLKRSPYFASLEIAYELICSKKESLYQNSWKKTSPKEIVYDQGYLYFTNYKTFCSVNTVLGQPVPFYKLEKGPGKKRITDVISYAGQCVKNIENICRCETRRCICLSPYLMLLSEDNWLCQNLKANGKLIKEIYVNPVGQQNVNFRYCDWDIYGERFYITTTRHNYPFRNSFKKSDTLALVALFTTFPIEFYCLMEIKRSVFGHNIGSVNISDQSLVIGKGSTHVEIYNFQEFLDLGTITPYKLGSSYGIEGQIGTFPTGLPLNFTYSSAPPILFKVSCMGQLIRFGGYPYHYITICASRCSEYRLTSLETGSHINFDEVIEPSIITDPIENVQFHPDQTNRIFFKKDCSVDVYKILLDGGNTRISKSYTMGLKWEPNDPTISSFGRPIKPRKLVSNIPPCTILSCDYDDELKIFAVLTKFLEDDEAFVLMYDSISGKELRSVKLKSDFDDSKLYTLFIDLHQIIIIEKNFQKSYTVHIYIM